MATYSWPSSLRPARVQLALQPNVRSFQSPFSGSISTVDLLGERWRMGLTLPARYAIEAGALEAFVFRLRGVHFVTAHHFGREAPRGTLRGTPTLSAAAAQGAASISVQTVAGATLKAGDMLGLSGMLLQVADDAMANGSGVIAVNLVNRLRAAVAAGAALTWDKPAATWRLADPAVPIVHVPGRADSVELDLVETW